MFCPTNTHKEVDSTKAAQWMADMKISTLTSGGPDWESFMKKKSKTTNKIVQLMFRNPQAKETHLDPCWVVFSSPHLTYKDRIINSGFSLYFGMVEDSLTLLKVFSCDQLLCFRKVMSTPTTFCTVYAAWVILSEPVHNVLQTICR